MIKPSGIHCMDCIEGMKLVRAKTVDEIVTDPPFGIDFKANRANYNRKASLVIDGYHEIKMDKYLQFTFDWIEQARRILKDSGSMYIFSGYNNLKAILLALDHHKLHWQQLIWKFNFGVYTQRKFVTSHYNILHVWKYNHKKRFYPDWRYSKKDRLPNGGSQQYADMESVWTIPKEYWTGELKTPNKLPSALCLKCIGYSSRKNDVVCDPFTGSGQVAMMAKRMGRRYIGFEIVPEYWKFAIQNIEEYGN